MIPSSVIRVSRKGLGICCSQLAILTLTTLHLGADVRADEMHSVAMHARYLTKPTEWCPSDQGVPVVVTSDGLRLHQLNDALRRERTDVTIGVRRGGDRSLVEVTNPTPQTSIRLRRGPEEARDVGIGASGRHLTVDDVEYLGTLHAVVRYCQRLWVPYINASADWHILGRNGDFVSEEIDQTISMSDLEPPRDHRRGISSFPQYYEFGGTRYVVMDKPTVSRTTEAFANPTKEDIR